MNRAVTVIALALALCGCGKKAEQAGKAAGGEVLPGTISDAMLDTSHSQAEAPLMPAKPAKAKDVTAPAEDASSAATDTAEAPAPDAKPSDAPKPAETPKPAAGKAP
ncbi:MAG: hypothetical protein RIS94_383 [Pseudomonadota bacterium]|jgi:hypothetical protein